MLTSFFAFLYILVIFNCTLLYIYRGKAREVP